MTDNETPAAPVAASEVKDEPNVGLPLWMPLAGLVIAFAFAVFVGVRICPTLSGVVLPPSSPLPTQGKFVELLHDQKGAGLDEYLYGTDEQGCNIARFYEKRLNECTYDPDSNCGSPQGTQPIQPGVGQLVARCTGTDTFGAYKVLWSVYISTGYAQDGVTHFRVIREVAG